MKKGDKWHYDDSECYNTFTGTYQYDGHEWILIERHDRNYQQIGDSFPLMKHFLTTGYEYHRDYLKYLGNSEIIPNK